MNMLIILLTNHQSSPSFEVFWNLLESDLSIRQIQYILLSVLKLGLCFHSISGLFFSNIRNVEPIQFIDNEWNERAKDSSG